LLDPRPFLDRVRGHRGNFGVSSSRGDVSLISPNPPKVFSLKKFTFYRGVLYHLCLANNQCFSVTYLGRRWLHGLTPNLPERVHLSAELFRRQLAFLNHQAHMIAWVLWVKCARFQKFFWLISLRNSNNGPLQSNFYAFEPWRKIRILILGLVYLFDIPQTATGALLKFLLNNYLRCLFQYNILVFAIFFQAGRPLLPVARRTKIIALTCHRRNTIHWTGIIA
jgi:hypothetical protein